MMIMKVLIVEDEQNVSNSIKKYILEIVPECEVLQVYSGEEAISVMDKNNIDAILIDRRLPGIDGFELADIIKKSSVFHMLPLVFITALEADTDKIMRKYKNYEYILKPISPKIFKEKLEHYLISIYKMCKISMGKSFVDDTRQFRTNNRVETINTRDIVFCEVYDRHITVYAKNQIVYEDIVMPLSEFIKKVNDTLFVQCHKSLAVNIREIKSIDILPNKIWEMKFGEVDKKCPIGIVYRDTIKSYYDAYNK